MLAFPEHVKPIMLFAILLPVIPTSVALWLLSRSVPQKVLNKIQEISTRVEDDQGKGRIDTQDIPKEIMPFVNSINRLLNYHRNRHQQERDFTAHASHELRTPLAGILLQTEIALATNDPQKRENALKNVVKSITRATRLVEQLLAISRLNNEKNDLAKEHVDLLSLFKRATKDQITTAQQKGIELTFNAQSESIFIEANEDSLYILADNLIRNALTFTPSFGRVEVCVSLNTEGTTALLKVKDSGPGIPHHMRERVMQRFEKGDTGSKSGTGLGLFIVKRIADLHDGDVFLRDNEDGKGLMAVVCLPQITGIQL